MWMIDILVVLAVALVVTGVLLAIRQVYRDGENTNRTQALGVDNVLTLQPGAINRTLSWSLSAHAPPRAIIAALVREIHLAGGETLRQDDRQAVIYFGSRTPSHQEGHGQWHALQTPVRIAAAVRRDGDTSILVIKLDEDYGLRTLEGTQRKRYYHRYRDAFAEIESLIAEAIGPFDPMPLDSHDSIPTSETPSLEPHTSLKRAD